MSSTVPPFHGDINFNAQHSPAGAFFSFTCGHFGTRGGFGLQIGKPGNQDLYIGVKDGDRFSDAPLKVLPLYEGAGPSESGRFDSYRILGNLEGVRVSSKREYLYHAFNEYLCFALFAAGSVLRRDEEKKLSKRIEDLLGQIRAT